MYSQCRDGGRIPTIIFLSQISGWQQKLHQWESLQKGRLDRVLTAHGKWCLHHRNCGFCCRPPSNNLSSRPSNSSSSSSWKWRATPFHCMHFLLCFKIHFFAKSKNIVNQNKYLKSETKKILAYQAPCNSGLELRLRLRTPPCDDILLWGVTKYNLRWKLVYQWWTYIKRRGQCYIKSERLVGTMMQLE